MEQGFVMLNKGPGLFGKRSLYSLCISGGNSEAAPVFVWGEDPSHGEKAKELFEAVRALTEKPFAIAAFDVSDWNGQFSPWEAPSPFGKEKFSGNGKETLKFLEKDFLPKVR
ncbi:MAG: hypothetical protein MJ184_11255, partial [Treponema sp.]|uniref:hypothetical protein n=1 Tax=Treponema sp. TaxID=166 RepID=UPI00298D9FD9